MSSYQTGSYSAGTRLAGENEAAPRGHEIVEAARAELSSLHKALIEQFVPGRQQEQRKLRNGFLWASSARTGLPTFPIRGSASC